ncbi:PIN domain-containing protein [Desulfotomaculum nigrificans]|uniref:PIN domain-containing protein n=1 Tax=Desulfotomaculum nigrificans TaxID=1565 RepID=UPI0001FAEB52|nr:PIN domain-containing protein [Desulfotomaculum nigrificans]
MSTLKKIRVFFDSSVLIAGLASPDGASNMLLVMCEMGFITPVISEKVVTEVIRNIERKLPRCLPHYHRLFKTLPFELADPTPELITQAQKMINQKDADILAAAINAGVAYLVSLDKHFLNINFPDCNIQICTPGDLLEKIELSEV